ncbi:hypothetical protein [Roseiconus lacunae]|uniref:hypothetical protein n=1 Tax=Roseiconus lacunae TaxID=2605694 RepID=UPI001E5A0C9E|nr:hypothetical protein [Roseiconus lacunae]MCD0458648.1 hypothetical protein [Roseiconus lacunae]
MTVTLFSPLRPSRELHRQTQRALKSHNEGRDYFTEITLTDGRRPCEMTVEYLVTATSPKSAERLGTVYLSQLCDLLSAVTRSPVEFHADPNDAIEERMRLGRRTMTIERKLTQEEWSWITGSLVALRREHPRFLAAASWYRKGLTGKDCLEVFCCYWRVIERIAATYADKSDWAPDERGARKCVTQLTSDLFGPDDTPELLGDEDRVKAVIKLRNDISHGNHPISVDMIEKASDETDLLEEAAFRVLESLRAKQMQFES